MSISRRDTIIIAVLVNVGLLAILLMTASQFHDGEQNYANVSQQFIVTKSENLPSSSIPVEVPLIPIALETTPAESYAQSPPTITTEQTISLENSTPASSGGRLLPQGDSEDKASKEKFVEITVKKGDFLEKIARANGTSVEEIKRVNRLTNDRLDVGQVLRIPLSQSKLPVSSTPKKDVLAVQDAVFYVVKSGDNPWKIARQFDVKYEDILRLNNLNEEKAKNLKIGDRIRVK